MTVAGSTEGAFTWARTGLLKPLTLDLVPGVGRIVSLTKTTRGSPHPCAWDGTGQGGAEAGLQWSPHGQVWLLLTVPAALPATWHEISGQCMGEKVLVFRKKDTALAFFFFVLTVPGGMFYRMEVLYRGC